MISFVTSPDYENLYDDNNSDKVFELTAVFKDNDSNLSNERNYNISIADIEEAPSISSVISSFNVNDNTAVTVDEVAQIDVNAVNLDATTTTVTMLEVQN